MEYLFQQFNDNIVIIISVIITFILSYLVLLLLKQQRQSKKMIRDFYLSNNDLYFSLRDQDFSKFFRNYNESVYLMDKIAKQLITQEKRLKENLKEDDYLKLINDKNAITTSVLSNVSHAIGTPISAIQLLILNSNDINEGLKKRLNDNIIQIKSILNGFSNLYNEKRQLEEKEKIKLYEGIEHICKLTELSKEKKISFNYKIEKDLECTKNCFDILKIPIVSIIENAIEASKDNSSIDISIYKKEEKTYFEFFNRGQSILNNEVFDIGYTTKKSNGIGLSMAKEIVEDALDGKISYENLKNGVQFKFYTNLNNNGN